jgi:hypothetical protein
MNALIFASETEVTHPLVIPAIAFALIAAGFFTFLGLVTYSYKNVANRHSQKFSSAEDHGAHH